ncbi:copper amine oxidase [Paenalkalicoccus suaedae]|uniref:Copper amine oxidase n=1 Tax=Paenalkalicoccus suaedae TaxID=2592382 RepID=A0A859FJA2_9BACI|nr:copper amine oxidase [Paenalkalicoccus suaedae]QKS72655.1 copper amine oxidase [Paenalkalicoccus suaedae]
MKMSKKSPIAVLLGISLLMPTAALAHDHSTDSGDHGGAIESSVSTPAAELRITLDTALTEHAFLAIEAMRKGADGAADFDQAAGALLANSDDIAAAVSSVYGEENGAAFLEIWNSHITYFVDYVVATGEGNQEGIDQALAELEEYKVEQAAFFATATEDRLPQPALEEGLMMHIDDLLEVFDAYVAGDFETAYTGEREAIHHMSMFAEQLSVAIADQFPDVFEGTNPDTPAVDLRADLNYIFTEHAGLAAMAMQDGIDGADSFDASAGALFANSDDLTAAVASVYGDEAGDAFLDIWNSHIGYFVDYVVATGGDDEAGQEQALADLDEYIVEQAAFLDAATEGRVPAEALEEGLTAHVGQLVTAFDAYVEGDYETAYTNIREAYAHMTMPAEALSAAIVDQFPELFTGAEMPEEMPRTGLGGSQTLPYAWIALGLLLAAAGTIMITRTRKEQ